MDPQLFDTIDRLAVYADETDRGFLSLARIYRWITGETFDTSLPSGKDVPRVMDSGKCRLPSFVNAMKSVYYLHEMAQTMIQDIVAIHQTSTEKWLDDIDIPSFQTLKTERERVTFLVQKGAVEERDTYMIQTDKARESAGIILGIATKLKEHFVTVTKDVKYRGEIDNKDIKNYMEKNTRLNCKK